MCQYSVEEQDGVPTDWHLVNLGAFARGGAGLVLTEATAVEPRGRITPQDAGLWNRRQAQEWRRVTRFISEQGAVPAVQLSHAGRKASTYRTFDPRSGSVPHHEGGWTTQAPSPLAHAALQRPDELGKHEIAGIVDRFRRSAGLAIEAGFEAVEIHGAHGYLIHQFLSPLSNSRRDEYGGSLENRARFLFEVVRAVRESIPEETPLLLRLSATDWSEGGWELDDTVFVARSAQEMGVDVVDVSSGGLVHDALIDVRPGYQVPLAAAVQRAGVVASAVGLITRAAQADSIVRSGEAAAVMIARELLRDPHTPLRWAGQLGAEVDYVPGPYRRAVKSGGWAPCPVP